MRTQSNYYENKVLGDLQTIIRTLRCESGGSGGDVCCPETNTLLGSIKTAIDNLDISVDNLVLNTDTLEINTDELETLLTTLNQLTLDENNESQVLLTDIRTNLQTLIDKLNQPCGGDTIKVDVCNLLPEVAIDTFQITDCDGNNVGTPQEVKKTVVLNSVTTKICNVQELADALNTLDIELVYTPSSKFHIGVNNFYSRDKVIYDSQTQSEVSRVTEYSTDGVTFTTTAPIGTPLIGWYVAPTNEYNTEDEILLTAGNSFVMNANEVHSYSISVLGNGTLSTIQIGANTPLPITNGYHKQMEFTNLNIQQVTISCGTGDEIRIILTKI